MLERRQARTAQQLRLAHSDFSRALATAERGCTTLLSIEMWRCSLQGFTLVLLLAGWHLLHFLFFWFGKNYIPKAAEYV